MAVNHFHYLGKESYRDTIIIASRDLPARMHSLFGMRSRNTLHLVKAINLRYVRIKFVRGRIQISLLRITGAYTGNFNHIITHTSTLNPKLRSYLLQMNGRVYIRMTTVVHVFHIIQMLVVILLLDGGLVVGSWSVSG
jgi:hypothetical protein